MDTTAGGSPDTARTGRRRGTGGHSAVRLHGSATDAAGVLVLSCCAVWALVSAAGRSARPEGTLLALLAVAAGFAAGRILGALMPVLAPAAAAATVLGLVLLPPSRLSGQGAPPLGPHDADAALLVLAAGAACCAAVAARGAGARVLLRLTGAGAAAAALALGSPAAFGAGVAVLLCSLAAVRIRGRAAALAGLALVAALVVGGSCAVAADALPAGLSQPLTGRLSGSRLALWHEAADLAERHPLRGVGPDRFADETSLLGGGATVTADSPQSAPLQLAAEQGVPGAALLGAAYGWMLCALWRSPRPTAVALTAAAALTGLAFLATVDHVLGSVVVTSAAGLLAGFATARPLAADDDG